MQTADFVDIPEMDDSQISSNNNQGTGQQQQLMTANMRQNSAMGGAEMINNTLSSAHKSLK